MGVDVLLYAEIEPTAEELGSAEILFARHTRIGDAWRRSDTLLESVTYRSPARIEVNTLSRVYSEHYHRGWWPAIYHDIRLLQACFSRSKIYYGGDGGEYTEELTEDRIEAIWMRWNEEKV